ncbi:MAG: DUF4340 domain-containing protein [Bacteroidetes bacterium]|nr:DUF4340 domain-containing protein [Bacteroidota bacterium]
MRKYRTTLLLAGVLVVLGVSWLVYDFSKQQGAVSKATAFAVPDTAGITRITLIRHFEKLPQEQQVVLTRKEGRWVVNDRFDASPRRVQDLLATLAHLHVREEVAPTAVSNAYKIIQSAHVEVRVEGSQSRTFFIGPAAPDKKGSLAYLAGSRQPVILELPGMQGSLAPQFATLPSDWQEFLLLSVNAETLRRLEVRYPGADSSFVLARQANGIWKLADGSPTDTVRTQQYMNAFGAVYALGRAENTNPGLFEVLAKQPPYARIRTTDAQGHTRELVLHQPLPQDPHVRYAWVTGQEELLLAQGFVIDKLLIRKQQLMPRPAGR